MWHTAAYKTGSGWLESGNALDSGVECQARQDELLEAPLKHHPDCRQTEAKSERASQLLHLLFRTSRLSQHNNKNETLTSPSTYIRLAAYAVRHASIIPHHDIVATEQTPLGPLQQHIT